MQTCKAALIMQLFGCFSHTSPPKLGHISLPSLRLPFHQIACRSCRTKNDVLHWTLQGEIGLSLLPLKSPSLFLVSDPVFKKLYLLEEVFRCLFALFLLLSLKKSCFIFMTVHMFTPGSCRVQAQPPLIWSTGVGLGAACLVLVSYCAEISVFKQEVSFLDFLKW